MNNTFLEGNLLFKFSETQIFEKFDDNKNVPQGMKSVDFIVDDRETVYFIEVKDYQNPKAKPERRCEDYKMLLNACYEKDTIYNLEMGQKIKDSLLRKYALGEKIINKIVFLLLINFDNLGSNERRILYERICGYIPTGLNDERYKNFSKISFNLVDIEQLKLYNILCTEINKLKTGLI